MGYTPHCIVAVSNDSMWMGFKLSWHIQLLWMEVHLKPDCVPLMENNCMTAKRKYSGWDVTYCNHPINIIIYVMYHCMNYTLDMALHIQRIMYGQEWVSSFVLTSVISLLIFLVAMKNKLEIWIKMRRLFFTAMHVKILCAVNVMKLALRNTMLASSCIRAGHDISAMLIILPEQTSLISTVFASCLEWMIHLWPCNKHPLPW